MHRRILLILLVFSLGCLQQGTGGEPGEVEKKIVPVPYSEESKSIVNPVPAGEESLAMGKIKYEVFCSMCHGSIGRGGEEVTKSFEVDPSSLVSNAVKARTDGELYWATSRGVDGTTMLAWGDLLSDEEIWHTVNYIRVLQNQE